MLRNCVRWGSWHGKGDPPGREQLDRLEPEPERVHGELGVVAVQLDQLGPVGVGSANPGDRGSLGAQVAEEALGGELGQEAVRVRDQRAARLVAEHHLLVRDKEQQQHGGIPARANRHHFRAVYTMMSRSPAPDRLASPPG